MVTQKPSDFKTPLLDDGGHGRYDTTAQLDASLQAISAMAHNIRMPKW
ncbi:hypothetical protein [Ochrobactrum sp. MYb379]